ncbi:MAG TPA: chemotaxis response regulator protein-glutamate methylesterase [Candidatus Sulfotelmatobacter sp.]|nr:chemotaxis response regulator protein-glutamate methylesterase [Candidatus Sulfotelmatobacter sp.]
MSASRIDHPRIRVLVVDDSAFMRTALSRMIEGEPDLEVVAAAGCGSCALEKIAAFDPDVVTLDVSMPGLDGLATLRCIMNQFPRPVLMVSAATEKDAEISFAALSSGAFDYVPKQMSASSLDIMHIRSNLVAKIRAAGQSRNQHFGSRNLSPKAPPSAGATLHPTLSVAPEIVAIGVSTGGPRALEQILPRFPKNFSLPILIVQHMPEGFTGSFAQRLDKLCSIRVHEAIDCESIQCGVAYIAPAGMHMEVCRKLPSGKTSISLHRRPENSPHIPSIDILMKSVAEIFKSRSIGVIMTGMGSDGAEGISAIYRQGGLTVGQDEATCAVYGMPRVCAHLGVLSRVVPLHAIPVQIIQATRRRRDA